MNYDDEPDSEKDVYNLKDTFENTNDPDTSEKKPATAKGLVFLIGPMIIDQFDMNMSNGIIFIERLTMYINATGIVNKKITL